MSNKENWFRFLPTGSLQAFQRLSLLICRCCSLLGWNQRVRPKMLLQSFEANRPQLMALDPHPHIHYSLAHNKFDIPAAKPLSPTSTLSLSLNPDKFQKLLSHRIGIQLSPIQFTLAHAWTIFHGKRPVVHRKSCVLLFQQQLLTVVSLWWM